MESLKQNIAKHEAIAAYMTIQGRPIEAEALRAKLEESRLRYEEWLSARMPKLDRLRADILDHAPDSAMSLNEFRPIYDALVGDRCEYWAVTHGIVRKRAVPTPIELKLAETEESKLGRVRIRGLCYNFLISYL